MFATLKTGTKIQIGFVVAIAIASPSASSVPRHHQLSGHVEEIGVVRLPSVQGCA